MRLWIHNLTELYSTLILIGIVTVSCNGTSYDFDTKPHDNNQKPQEAPATGARTTKPSGALLFTTETHEVIKDNKLDILVLVDSSESMKDIRGELKSKLESLIKSVEDTDWSVGISSLDINKPCIEALIKKDDADKYQKFNQAISSLQPANQEQNGILKIEQALTCSSEFSGGKSWIQEGSSVAVVIISDKDNSSKTQLDPQSATQLPSDEYLLKQLAGIRTPKDSLRVYGIISVPNSTSCSKREQSSWGQVYSSLIHKTGGIEGSVCSSNLDSTLQVLSLNISQNLTKHYKLQYTPVSLQVFLDGKELKTGFTHSANLVKLPTLDTEVEKIRFEYFYRP